MFGFFFAVRNKVLKITPEFNKVNYSSKINNNKKELNALVADAEKAYVVSARFCEI